MAGTIQCGRRSRKDFGKIPSIVEIPNLIEVQKRSYQTFLQKDIEVERREDIGLQAVFKSVFPIADYNDNGKALASGKSLFSARVIPYRGSWVEFDFDANDVLHVRVDRRRKMLATAFLRAFWFLEKNHILSYEEILSHFYETEEVLSFEEGNAWVKFNPDAHEGAKVAEDVKPPRHREPLVAAGKVLNTKLVEKLLEAGVEKIAVRPEALVGRHTASRIVDTESGEVVLESNAEITSTVLSSVMSRRVAPFKLLVLLLPLPGLKPVDKKTDASLYETLAKDHFKNPDEALVEIYRRLRPGDPPTNDSARALFR